MNKIKFICGDRHVAKHSPPIPTAKARPDWYNALPGFIGEPLQSPPTIKKCMPVYDHLTAGYIVHNPVEQEITIGERPAQDGSPVESFRRLYPQAWTRQEEQEGHSHEQCPVKLDGAQNLKRLYYL